MQNPCFRTGLRLVAPILLSLAPGLAAQAPPEPAQLKDLAFLTGHWVGGEGQDVSEETWVAPVGDSMMGMWRYVSSGRTRIFEILTIKAEEAGLVLRIRHFDAKLVGREDKERPVALPLVSWGAQEVAFEGAHDSGPGKVRLSYRRTGADRLLGILEKEGRTEEFSFVRK